MCAHYGVENYYHRQHLIAQTMGNQEISSVPCKLTLQNQDLWHRFHKHETEMIITKAGRRMFPHVRLSVDNLDPEAFYCIFLELQPVGQSRFKYNGTSWVSAGSADPQSHQRVVMHPDSPATGSHWNSQHISFTKAKLTNNTMDNSGHIVLTSMHQYQPVIHVVKTANPSFVDWTTPTQKFTFPETKFIAVTAYQNEFITKLKIDHNPFAKGFRETGQSRCKRKREARETSEEREIIKRPCSTSPNSTTSSSDEGSPEKERTYEKGIMDKKTQHLQDKSVDMKELHYERIRQLDYDRRMLSHGYRYNQHLVNPIYDLSMPYHLDAHHAFANYFASMHTQRIGSAYPAHLPYPKPVYPILGPPPPAHSSELMDLTAKINKMTNFSIAALLK